MKKHILFGLLLVSLLVTGCAREVCVDKESGAELSLKEAEEIAAKSECGDNIKAGHICNDFTGTWWIDLDIEKPGCSPACVVDVNTKTASINWRCTGLIPE
jgi:hypothetical protein